MARFGAARSRSLLQPRHSPANYCPLGVCHLDNGHHLSSCLKQCPSFTLSWGSPNADKGRSSDTQSLDNSGEISRPSGMHSLGLKNCGCPGTSSLPCPCRTPIKPRCGCANVWTSCAQVGTHHAPQLPYQMIADNQIAWLPLELHPRRFTSQAFNCRRERGHHSLAQPPLPLHRRSFVEGEDRGRAETAR